MATLPQRNYNDTVYVRNINEKVSLNTIKKKLTELCGPFGPVLSVTAHKNLKMRGQAFVAFENEEKAKKAVAALNGIEVFQKKLEAALAKSSSNVRVEANLEDEGYEKYLRERSDYKKQQDEKKEQESKSKLVKVNLEDMPPNKLLLLQGLPKDVTKEEITEVYSKFKGFVEIRLVAVRSVAFVEFETDKDAIPAMKETQGLTIRDTKVTVNFAKK